MAHASFWRRNRWILWVGAALLTLLICVSIALSYVAHHFEPFLRAEIVAGLQERFHTRVELDRFHAQLRHGQQGEWGIWATGQGLRIWPPQHTGGNHPLEIAVQSLPIIQMEEFSFHVPLRTDLARTMRVSEVRLKGLAIRVPPRSERDTKTGFESALDEEGNAGMAQPPANSNSLAKLMIRRIVCDGAVLVMETDKPDKLPLRFDIEHLSLTNVTANGPMGFEADFTNPKPPGHVVASGNFGPWITAAPGNSHLDGNYRFDHADLSVFKGIAGTLESNGSFHGTLHDINAQGEAFVPDFRLTHFVNTVPLHTRFYARVDGTDGDTWLDQVEATLGASHFTTAGKVVQVKGLNANGSVSSAPANTRTAPKDGGHLIDLKVDVDRGRIEDFLRLASNTPVPLLTGLLVAKATLHIPPGKDVVRDRMTVDGFFKLSQARFTNAKIQGKIGDLSERGQGHPNAVKTMDPNSVVSEMQGNFSMARAELTFPNLHYEIPGAQLELKGTYSLDGALSFDGTARTQATVSQMVGGWKGFLLKPADRIFKKDGAGMLIPLKVRGTRTAPEFGLDFDRMKTTTLQTPETKQ